MDVQSRTDFKFKPIINDTLRSAENTSHTTFDAKRHLSFTESPKVLTMKDIGAENTGISPVAVSEPFPLFTQEAILAMRTEILKPEVWENCLYSTEFAACQLRGHCPKYAPFMYDAWKDPRTISIVSKIAGIDLVPIVDYEIGNINIAVADESRKSVTGDTAGVTHLHRDSYPFVCVVMMSDASNMVGGETAVKTASGEIIKVRGPQMGCAVVLQGRYIDHQALAATRGSERITMITAYRPRDPMLQDDSVLTSIRPISNLSEIYFQWSDYRLEVLEERIRALRKVMWIQHSLGRDTDTKRVKAFLRDQEEYLTQTNKEIIENIGKV
ncbi:hypothetical protein K402DRAFT_366323 [Aulographum hederae CBS 113979]|uniref:Fe2OG dioxygenase domain-containing protein n=1 Tax=Aulographum hederae CBS 113979 TaxID=1176131 RepID=A0A6G1HGU4_9PEZI|nr:hypothetical protein K402DRAFT_366323 [Aulographum hederae CBS 113979]